MYPDDLLLSRSMYPGLCSPCGGGLGLGRGSPFNRSRHSRYGLGECTTCYLDPITRRHSCPCLETEQCLERGRLIQAYCDCHQYPLAEPFGYTDGLYFAGYGRGFGLGHGDNYYGNVGGRGSFHSWLGGPGGLGSLGMRGHGRFGGLGELGGLGRHRNIL